MIEDLDNYLKKLRVREALEEYRKAKEARGGARQERYDQIVAEFPDRVREASPDGALFYSSPSGVIGNIVLSNGGEAGQVLLSGVSFNNVVEIIRLLESETTSS